MKLARSLAALLAFPALAQEAPESPWLTDHELARSRARNERRDLLMVFLGPAAAGGNAAIERDVLGSKDFTNDALQRFVLARFDYPEPASKLPDALQRENERLLRKYESPELPVVWLEDQSGTVYARLGYVPVGGKPFLAMLDSRREAAKQASATLARAAGLSGIARAQALAEGLRHLDDHVVALAHYREMLEIIQTDADGAAGLKAEFDAIARDAAMRPLRTRMQSELEPRIAEQA
ncbi:MAG: hypothetical protein KDE27_10770, partial [Planctomycetes bacterium]|nr:hypothetical protein [Planctomycetota bacterium]